MLKNKKQKYPTKTTLNLVVRERAAGSGVKFTAGIIVIVILAALFSKFAVIDILGRANDKQNELKDLKSQLAVYQKENADYYDLSEQYEKYFTSISEGGVTYISFSEVMDIISKNLMRNADVKSISLSENKMSVVLTNTTLTDATEMLEQLYAIETVQSVQLYTAEDAADGSVSLSMTIVFNLDMDEKGGDAQ